MLESKFAQLPDTQKISPIELAFCDNLKDVDTYVCTPVTSQGKLIGEFNLAERKIANEKLARLELAHLFAAKMISAKKMYFPPSVGSRHLENGEHWRETDYLVLSMILLLGMKEEDAKDFSQSLMIAPEVEVVMNDYDSSIASRKIGYDLMAKKVVEIVGPMSLEPKAMIEISGAKDSLGCGVERYVARQVGIPIINLRR